MVKEDDFLLSVCLSPSVRIRFFPFEINSSNFLPGSILINQGSGIGCMIIARVICEVILMRLHRNRKEYRENKVKIFHLNKSNNDPTDHV